jgi:hypothetical protein
MGRILLKLGKNKSCCSNSTFATSREDSYPRRVTKEVRYYCSNNAFARSQDEKAR